MRITKHKFYFLIFLNFHIMKKRKGIKHEQSTKHDKKTSLWWNSLPMRQMYINAWHIAIIFSVVLFINGHFILLLLPKIMQNVNLLMEIYIIRKLKVLQRLSWTNLISTASENSASQRDLQLILKGLSSVIQIEDNLYTVRTRLSAGALI